MQATSSPNGYLFLSPARYRTTKGTGPARFGSASVVTKAGRNQS